MCKSTTRSLVVWGHALVLGWLLPARPALCDETRRGDAKGAPSIITKKEESSPSPAAAMLEQAKTIQRKTSQIRGLRVRRAIPMGVESRKEILEQIERKLARDYTAAEIEAEAAVLKRLGLIPAGMDYRGTVLALLQDQVAGYYDPEQRRLRLAEWLPMSMQAPALSHEICHALQDQHFDLRRFIKPRKDNSDLQLAQAALVEGDCTGVMVEYLLAAQGLDLGHLGSLSPELLNAALSAGGSPQLKRAPRFLQQTLLFPYLQGLRLMQGIRATLPWSTVSQMFRRPPQSTEQVLHPEKYWKHEAPVVIKSATLPALADWSELKRDTLGEFELGLYLGLGAPEEVARRAAEGWGGDLLIAYRDAERATSIRREKPVLPLLVHLSTWDSPADAQEFANAQRHVFAASKLTEGKPESDQLWVYSSPDGEESSVQLVKEHVLVVTGAPSELRQRLQREVWDHWRVAGRRVKP